jgi:hypothetical protein
VDPEQNSSAISAKRTADEALKAQENTPNQKGKVTIEAKNLTRTINPF